MLNRCVSSTFLSHFVQSFCILEQIDDRERASAARVRESIRVCVHRDATATYRDLLSRASGRCIGDTASIDIDDVDPVTANAHARERASEQLMSTAPAHVRDIHAHRARARGTCIETRAHAYSTLTLVTRRSRGRERLPAADVFTLVFAQSPRPCEVRLRLGWPFSRARVFPDVFFFLFPRRYLPGGVLNSVASNCATLCKNSSRTWLSLARPFHFARTAGKEVRTYYALSVRR